MLIESTTTQPNSHLLILPFPESLVYLTSNKALVIGFPRLMFVLNYIEEIDNEKENTWPVINVEYIEFMNNFP